MRLAQGAPARLHVVEREERSSPFGIHMEGLPGALAGAFVGVMLQSRALDTTAQAGAIWPMKEDVAKMRLALGTADLRPPRQ